MKKFLTIKEERKAKENTISKKALNWIKNKQYLNQNFANGVLKARKTAGVMLLFAFIAQAGMGVLGTGAASNIRPQADPNLEGSLAVANVTAGGSYQDNFVNAMTDDVVKFELAYHNNQPPDSGLIATNALVRITLPTGASTNLVTTGTITTSNSNSINDTAAVHTQFPDTLQYIAGSAKWRHNIGTNEAPNFVTQDISDSVTTTGFNIGDIRPCNNFQGTVTILARLMGTSLRVEKSVANLGGSWVNQNSAEPGERIAYLISYTNTGNTTLTNMVVGDNFPPYMTYVPGSTIMVTGRYPNGVSVPDGVTTGGIRVGNYAPGAGGHIRFEMTVNSTGIPAGCHDLRNVGIARADQTQDIWDTAITRVCVVTPQAPEFRTSKSAFNITQGVDAASSIARSGDVIRYDLITENIGDAVGEYHVQDDITNVLQYADVTDTGGGTLVGNIMDYGNVSINPGESVTRSFNVVIKSSAVIPGACGIHSMVNVYGTNLSIDLNKACVEGSVLGAVTSLPRAGSANLIVMFGLMLFMIVSSVFLYYREKWLLVDTLRSI